MDLRPFLPADRDACLAIFDSNVPRFFSPSERVQFESFLERPEGPYFVMEHDGAAIGCGGYSLSGETGLASLVWGMIRSDSHGLGLGRFLLMFRLREIGKVGNIQRVRLETSQQTAGFFEGQGFKVVGIAVGRVEMVKKLTVCP